jgi:7-cyano-7-deazaguanine synthase
MKRAVVLLSGGLDSAIEAAKKIARKANCRFRIVKIKLAWRGSSLLDKRLKLPAGRQQLASAIPSTYVPGRNIIFLSFALSCTEAIGAERIFIGAHTGDYSGYPDCRPEFFRAFAKVIATGTKSGVEKHGIKVSAPLIHKGKARIIKLGARLKVPFGLTWSCYRGARNPCGRCDSCYFRAKGFREAGLKDQ